MTTPTTILIADKVDTDIIEQLQQQYGADNVHVRTHDGFDPTSDDKSAITAVDVATLQPDIMVVRSTHFDTKAAQDALDMLKENGKNTLFIRAGTGVDNLKEAAKRGFVVENTDGANRMGVADLQLGMMAKLALGDRLDAVKLTDTPTTSLEVLKLIVARREIFDGKHSGNARETLTDDMLDILRNDPLPEFVGKNMLVVGATGNIGKEMTKVAHALGMTPIASAERKSMTGAFAVQHGITTVPTLDDGMAQADFVSINTALNQHTKGMLSQARFDMMKPSAIVLNTARAAIVEAGVKTDVTLAIDDAKATIDALELDAPNLHYTPKRGAKTVEATAMVGTMVKSQIDAYIERGEYVNVTNPEAKDKRADLKNPRSVVRKQGGFTNNLGDPNAERFR